MGRKKHLVQLTEFRKAVEQDISIDKLILFGSRAWGKAHRWSDFDLVVVSPNFRRKQFRDRGLNLYNHWHLDYPVDFLCYTPEEFKKLKKQITLVREEVREGIEIKSS